MLFFQKCWFVKGKRRPLNTKYSFTLFKMLFVHRNCRAYIANSRQTKNVDLEASSKQWTYTCLLKVTTRKKYNYKSLFLKYI